MFEIVQRWKHPKEISVLITGGAGYFGRAFAEYLIRETIAARVCIYSRDEYKHALLRQDAASWESATVAPEKRMRYFIGDVRDVQRLTRAMQGCNVVIHAAALKRVEVGETDPEEMAKTNVMGAVNVIEAARLAKVDRVIMLSTDKACMPINAYGASKLLAEKLFLAANANSGRRGPKFAVTRYGNVSGSTGSVIPTWRKLIANGALTVPVTDLRCTRFWMDLHHAVGLVNWTMTRMIGGETVVPTLPAYRVGDLAAAMGGRAVEVGLKSGEKFDESMVSPWECQEFRYIEPQLVRGGLAEGMAPNIESVPTRMLTVDELRELLKTV